MQVTWKTPAGQTWKLCDDVLKQTHCIIAGRTGSGKSTLLHSIIYSALIHSPVRTQFVLVDLKRGITLRRYKDLPHTITLASTPEQAIEAIKYTERLMDQRYDQVLRTDKDMYEGSDIYLIIDELADLMQTAKAKVLDPLSRIMRLGRAARVHVIGATQSPSRTRGGGLPTELQVNTTSGIALPCRTAIESRQACAQAGAEKLEVGQGIYWSPAGTTTVSIPMTGEKELKDRIAYWLNAKPERSIPNASRSNSTGIFGRMFRR